MSLKKNFIYSSILTVSTYLFPLIVYPYVSRTLGLSNIGIVNFVDNLVNYFVFLSMMGISTVGIREIAAVRSNRRSLSATFMSLLTLTIITTLIAIATLWIAMYTVPKLFPFRDLLYVGLVKLVFNLLLIEWLFVGMENFKYITQRLNAAAWLINSIEQRRTTIRHVVEEILRRQPEFMAQGKNALRPMTMKDVADAIGVHESTVSRAVANKYVQLPNGIMALRRFFSANLAKSGSGEDFAAVQAKTAIEELIKGEDPHRPLSDQKLCELLKERQMDISRRTVMKYREQLGYP